MMKKRKAGRVLLSFLLSLAMVIGFMPGMGMTAHAEEPTEALLTTITATGKEQASYSTENIATVSFSYTASGSSDYYAGWGWWGYGWIATVTPADGYTITKCVFYDDANRTATDREDPFVVETTEADKEPQVNGMPILAYTSKGITKIEVYGYANPTTVDVTGVSLNKTTATLTVGDTETLTATVSPDDATDKTVTWLSSDTAVATVENGVVTAVGSGSANITVTTTDGSKMASCAVTVNAATPSVVNVTGVEINKTSTTLTVGGTETLTATVSPDDATDKSVKWSSDNTSVATVDANGKVTAVAEGTATITVTATNGTENTSDDKTATCAVTVNAATPSVVNVTGVEINKTSTTLTVGGTETLTATVSPDDATDKSVMWSSDNTSVATVDANGKVTAVAAGTATITVTTIDGSKTATCSVTVNAADSDSDDDSSSNSSSNDSNNDSLNNNNSSNDSENSNSEPKAETPYDYLEPLRGELKAEIALGGERTVTWDQGTALPYDIMKTLQDNPGVTLIFSYTYQGIDYKVTISGKDAKAYTEIPWYGPLYLYNHYGTLSETAPADTADTAIGTRTYTVIPGDTLSEIATKLNTTVDSLVSLNDIKNRDFILVGQIFKY